MVPKFKLDLSSVDKEAQNAPKEEYQMI